VGMLSALRPEKAHDVALAAVRLIRERYPALRLVIVGHGPSAAQIARLAGDLNETVIMAGPRSDVMRWFEAFDICLHPSRADAFPTTLIEAMAASVPVVATAVGGIPEIVVDGRTGILIPAPPSADALARALAALLDDPARRRALGSAARIAYERRFTAAPWLMQTRDMYEEVLAESRLRAPRQRSCTSVGMS
jgi:glycosyltransferase involved in cell wall biosynthesis